MFKELKIILLCSMKYIEKFINNMKEYFRI